MAVDLTNKIHGDFSTGSGVWMGYRGDITGAYITEEGTGANYVIYSNKLIREYNEKISELDQPKSLYIEPNDAGFRYTNKPLLGTYNGAAGAYSTRTVGFGGPLMRVKGGGGSTYDAEEVDVRGDINGNISLNSPLIPTGTRAVYTGSHKKYYHHITMSGKDYRVTYVKDVEYPDISGYLIDHYGDFTASPFLSNGTWYTKLASGQQPEGLGESYILYPYLISTLMGGYFAGFQPNIYGTSEGYAVEALGIGTGPLNWVLNVDPIYSSLGGWTWDNDYGYNAPQTCSIWYDQAATGDAQNNLTQTTAADQPILCSNGVLQTDSSGNAALDFNGSTHHMVLETGLAATLNVSGIAAYTVFEPDDVAGTQIVSSLASYSTAGLNRFYNPWIGDSLFKYSYGTASPWASGSSNTNLNLSSLVADQTQGDAKAFLNGSQIGSATALINRAGQRSDTTVGVGAVADASHFDGKMGEFIWYTGQSVSVNRVAIESNINNHFKIY